MSRSQTAASGSAHQSPRSYPGTLREALQLLWSAADAYAKRRLLLALALVAGAALLAALSPIALKLTIDALSGTGRGGVAAAPVLLVVAYVLGQYLTRACTELRVLAHGQAEQRVRRKIGQRLFEHLLRLPMRFHLERKIGAIGETAEQGNRGYQLLLQHLVFTILPVTIELSTVAVVLLHFGHETYLAIFIVAALAYVWAFRRGAIQVQEPAHTVSSAHIEAHSVLTDSLLNYETVKYFDAEPVVSDRYHHALGRTESAWRRFFQRRAANGSLVAGIFALSLGLSLTYAARDVMQGAMTIGDFVLIHGYVIRLVQPLEMLGYAVRDLAQGLAFLQRMLDLFREETEGASTRGGTVPVVRGELEFEHVSFSYRRDCIVLDDVSFRVPAGRTVAVVGVSGSGKSSLIRLLFRLYEPDAGRILLDGKPISGMSLSVVRRAIAVVPQDTVLFHDTIARNIGFGRFGSSRPEIEEAARVAHLHDFIMGLPEEYETMVGERGLKLSGGERQRVAIARAALKRPRIFVFDEATSSLDSRTEREILRNLLEVSKHGTTLVIAHRLSTIVHADEIIVLDRGRVIERGTHAQLLDRNGWYAALWRAQHGEMDQSREGISRPSTGERSETGASGARSCSAVSLNSSGRRAR
ncbi:MAG TPA: ATP-binding cassette domain-containing protein [Steroidobacteraceae bacterium]